MATAHGGQVVVSKRTASLIRGSFAGTLTDLGQHQLKDLQAPERVYQLAHTGLETDFPPLRSVGRPNNLPADMSTFVGRRDELDSLHELLTTPGVRIVTVTGPGGTGKTRLALQAAEGLLDSFPDGVFFVALAPLVDADLVTSAIAAVLGVQSSADRTLVEALITHLAGKELLLVLDNFEHMVRATADVAAVLAHAPGARVLATSRVPLRVRGEHEFRVNPLPLPEPEAELDDVLRSPAVQLFGERAREIRHDFALTAANERAVSEVCRRLDGLPLAIELAAAMSRLLSPQAMLERLEDRLGLPASDATDLPARQRTLRDTISWSYELLAKPEQALFRRLAVFRGGCDLAAAESVCGTDGLSTLSTLVQHSLVETRWNELGDTRYELLETIAEFARERLEESGEAGELAERHAEYFAVHAETVEPSLYSDARAPWLVRLSDDRDNFRAALAWSVDRDEAAVGLRIMGALWLWWWTAFSEGLFWADRLLALPSAGEPTLLRARSALHGGDLRRRRGRQRGDPWLCRGSSRAQPELGDDRLLALAQGLGAGALGRLDPKRRADLSSIRTEWSAPTNSAPTR